MQRLLFGFFLCSLFSYAEISDSDSGIFGPKYSEILSATQDWKSINPAWVNLIDYGKTVENRTLRMVLVTNPNATLANRPTFIMSGSTHGNEYLGLENKIPYELLKKSQTKGTIKNFLDAGGAFVFVPILNPDGYEARERENAHNVDLNRDWDVAPANFKAFKEPETKLLAQKLEDLSQSPYRLDYKVTVDYHCCIGAILYPWSYTDKPIPAQDLDSHMRFASIAKAELNIEAGTSNDILGYMPMGTTKDYYYAKYGARTFTYEGRYREEDSKLYEHLSWWEKMVDAIRVETELHYKQISLLSFWKMP